MGKQSIGSRLREARENKGLDQSILAAEIEVTTRTLQRWEKGEQIPDAVSVLHIAEVTGVLPHWLLSGEGEVYAKKADEVNSGTGLLGARMSKLRFQLIPLLSSVPAGKPLLN